jgi:hypothetical protein
MPGSHGEEPNQMTDVERVLHLADLLRAPDAPKFKSQRLAWYLTAGSWIMTATPTFERDLWERLLVQPLEEIVAEAPATNVGGFASEILERVTKTMAEQK